MPPCTVPAIMAIVSAPIAQRETVSVMRSQTSSQRSASAGSSIARTHAAQALHVDEEEEREEDEREDREPDRERRPATPEDRRDRMRDRRPRGSTLPAGRSRRRPSRRPTTARRSRAAPATRSGRLLRKSRSDADERDEQEEREQGDGDGRAQHDDRRREPAAQLRPAHERAQRDLEHEREEDPEEDEEQRVADRDDRGGERGRPAPRRGACATGPRTARCDKALTWQAPRLAASDRGCAASSRAPREHKAALGERWP